MRPLLIALVVLALLEAVLGQLAAVNHAQETNNETWPSGVKNSGSGYGSISGNNIGRPNLPGLSGSSYGGSTGGVSNPSISSGFGVGGSAAAGAAGSVGGSLSGTSGGPSFSAGGSDSAVGSGLGVIGGAGSGYGSISGNNIGRPSLPGLSGSTGVIAGGHGKLPGASGSATPGSHNCTSRETWKEGESGSCGERNCRFRKYYPDGRTTACTMDALSKCFCKDQYVRRDADNKCVKLEECDDVRRPPPTPGSHNCTSRETWKEGESSSCGERNCRFRKYYPDGKTTACTLDAVSKCFCKDQYVRRDADNKCVKLEECDDVKRPPPTPGSHNCTSRETWKEGESGSCGERNCRFRKYYPDGRTTACTMDAVSKCFCKDQYVRRDADNKCVKLEECDDVKRPPPTPGSHNCTSRETWKEGQSGSCGEANCRYLPQYHNGKTIACTLDSVSKCFCKDQYVRRDRDNKCVKLQECDNFKQPMLAIKKGA